MMENVLDRIVANKRIEVEKQKKQKNIGELAKLITDCENTNSFKQALINSSTGIIAEFKRRSPSRGWIFESAKVEYVVPKYTEYGATAISVLTDTDFFGGTFEDFAKARESTSVPLLRKDFIIDEYQIFEAKVMKANAVLLIASALTTEQTRKFAARVKELGMDVLLEIHNAEELEYINEYVDVVGVNNRNLNTFVTDIKVSLDLSDKIPKEYVKISESGISNPQTVMDLRQIGYRGFLMGENFMKTDDPGKALKLFISQLI